MLHPKCTYATISLLDLIKTTSQASNQIFNYLPNVAKKSAKFLNYQKSSLPHQTMHFFGNIYEAPPRSLHCYQSFEINNHLLLNIFIHRCFNWVKCAILSGFLQNKALSEFSNLNRNLILHMISIKQSHTSVCLISARYKCYSYYLNN